MTFQNDSVSIFSMTLVSLGCRNAVVAICLQPCPILHICELFFRFGDCYFFRWGFGVLIIENNKLDKFIPEITFRRLYTRTFRNRFLTSIEPLEKYVFLTPRMYLVDIKSDFIFTYFKFVICSVDDIFEEGFFLMIITYLSRFKEIT